MQKGTYRYLPQHAPVPLIALIVQVMMDTADGILKHRLVLFLTTF